MVLLHGVLGLLGMRLLDAYMWFQLIIVDLGVIFSVVLLCVIVVIVWLLILLVLVRIISLAILFLVSRFRFGDIAFLVTIPVVDNARRGTIGVGRGLLGNKGLQLLRLEPIAEQLPGLELANGGIFEDSVSAEIEASD
jgi:hypothetical protein